MENYVVAFIVIISVLYIGLQHLYNWALRKFYKDFEPGLIVITLFYLMLTGLYWYYLIEAFSLIL
jgi:hypothetical protein